MRPGLQCFSSSLPRWRSCRSNNVQSPVSFQLPAGLTALRVQYLSSYLSPLQEERLRRFAAAVYPLLCQLWCADLRPEVVIASCQRWSNLRDIKIVFVLFRCAVCSDPCFCGSALSMAFQTLLMELGMQRWYMDHILFRCQFLLQVENVASWCRDEKTIWAPLWFSQWARHSPLLMVPEIVRTNLYIPSETFQFE